MPQGWSHIALQGMLPWLAAGGSVVAIAVVVWLVRIVMRSDRVPRGGVRLTLAEQRALERDMGRLVSELAEMARQVGGELDERSVRLEELIEQADERIADLERAREAASTQSARPIAPSPLPAHPAIAPTPVRSDAEEKIDPRHVEIYTLADQGLALEDIARRVRQPSGEIGLILALRQTGRHESQSSDTGPRTGRLS